MPLLNRARELDQRAFDAVAAARLPGLEYVLPRLSRIADHSVLWCGVAGVLNATGRPRLRRAALRGVMAIGVASPLANLAGKQTFRRRRPLVELIGPPLRRHRALAESADASLRRPASPGRALGRPPLGRPPLRRPPSGRPARRIAGTRIPAIRSPWRLPTSPSFPSGHSASAAAFATGVMMEAPFAVAAPVTLAAAAVAFSRVYTGAHYPGDVLAGLALGTAAGLGTRLIWPTRPAPARAPWAMTAESVPGVSGDGAGVAVVVNPDAGGGDQSGLIAAELPAAEIVEAGEDVDKALHEAADRAVVLGVCGGDGTVRAAAAVALERGLPLLVIPGGTLNHFARALGIETPADAFAAYRTGCVVRVDVADAGDEIFLNTASFGAYTDLVRRRERLEQRLGKWPALAAAAVRVLRDAEPAEVYVGDRRMRVWFAFIGNGAYGSRGVAPTWRSRLDDGLLDVRLIGAKRHISRSRAVAALFLGHLRLLPEYAAWRTGSLRLAGADGPLRLTRDGEVGAPEGAVTITKRRAALPVFVPPKVADDGS